MGGIADDVGDINQDLHTSSSPERQDLGILTRASKALLCFSPPSSQWYSERLPGSRHTGVSHRIQRVALPSSCTDPAGFSVASMGVWREKLKMPCVPGKRVSPLPRARAYRTVFFLSFLPLNAYSSYTNGLVVTIGPMMTCQGPPGPVRRRYYGVCVARHTVCHDPWL